MLVPSNMTEGPKHTLKEHYSNTDHGAVDNTRGKEIHPTASVGFTVIFSRDQPSFDLHFGQFDLELYSLSDLEL